MSEIRFSPVKVSPLPPNVREQWKEARAQLISVVQKLKAATAEGFIRRFAEAAIRDGCSELQLDQAYEICRNSGLGDVFVLARSDAEITEGAHSQELVFPFSS
ncbi:uncharacterized protein JN550_011307 [Neoarthrinium moseri]|uniref:uncharacterized protein n=1 Tax=Neoarthrinium moseri TaxID=1658444 RepID=UPI001FDE789F|nr:uncharacterized protein JN550_011307 [Neoarthrinium moseri]KAI1860706.1 hypothetical protein JN550_011307 [Neoarthrinium moseri]